MERDETTGLTLGRRTLLAGTAAASAGALLPRAVARAQDGATPETDPIPAATPEGTPGPNFAPNAQMQEVLDEYAQINSIPIESQGPFNARQLPLASDAVLALLSERGQPGQALVGDVDHVLVAGAEGELVARVYTPDATAGSAPFPVLVYFHGGGFVIANLNTYDGSCRALTNATGAVVVSVAYRQAPEDPFPAAPEDAYAATQYVIENADLFQGDPTKVAVVGESAGGNLAAVTCLLARERGGQMPVHQVLVYPITTYAPEGEAAESIEEQAFAQPLNAALLDWFEGYYEPDESDFIASPLEAESLEGLPPATVILAQLDPLRSQGEVYAQALADAGVDTEVQVFEGVTHEFFGMGAVVDVAQEAVALAAARLAATFNTL